MRLAATSLFAVLLGTTTLSAQTLSLPEVLSALEAQGFTEIEVSRERGRLKIEAEGSGMSRELVYDTRSGEILVDDARFDDGDDDDDDDGDNRGIRGDDDDDDDDDDDSDDDDDRGDDDDGDDDSGDDD